MISITATLLAALGKSISPKYKVVLSRAGFTSVTYEDDSANPILEMEGSENGLLQSAYIWIKNQDQALTAKNFLGYTATIGVGGVTSAGDEYAGRAPLRVIDQVYTSSPFGDGLVCVLYAVGKANLMAMDKAACDFVAGSQDTETVKDIIGEICAGNGRVSSAFGHCEAITVSWDVEDWLIDDYRPFEDFKVYQGQNRLELLEYWLQFTGCDARFEDDGELHIFMTYAREWQADFNYYAGEIVVPTVPDDWTANTVYALNARVKPTSENDYYYICTTAGTSHATTEPTWPVLDGETITDGTVVWTCIDINYIYTALTTSEVSGSSEPTWPRTSEANVEDGNVVWALHYDYEYVI